MSKMVFFPNRLLRFFDKQRKSLGLLKQNYDFFVGGSGVVEFYSQTGNKTDIFYINFKEGKVTHDDRTISKGIDKNKEFNLKNIKKYFENMLKERCEEKAPE